jgi:sugar/nucleoside kinase (ribokinase family)
MNQSEGVCLFAGYLNYDITLQLNSAMGTEKRINSVIHTSVGGMAANAASFSAYLGSRSLLFASIGDDAIGQYLKQTLEKFNVDTRYLDFQTEVKSPHCIVHVDSDGQRTIISENINFNYKLILDYIPKNFEKIKIIYLDGYRFSDCDELLKLSKEYNIPTVIDLDGYERQEIDFSKLCSFDTIILNKTILKQLTSIENLKSNKNYFKNLESNKIICTQGENGVETLHNQTLTIMPATKVKVVDTTGAGDAFAGSYTHNAAKRLSFLENVEKAITVASCSTSYLGSLGLLEENCETV